jgi:hypothetical protein
MKELRFDAANGAWRLAFAFDTKREAILLIAGDKAGTSQQRFLSGADSQSRRSLRSPFVAP